MRYLWGQKDKQTCILTNEIQIKYNWYVICFQYFILLQNQPEEGDKQDFFLTSGLCNESRLGAVELEDDFSVAVQLLRCFGWCESRVLCLVVFVVPVEPVEPLKIVA